MDLPEQMVPFTLHDEFAGSGLINGKIVVKNGQLVIHIDGHGNAAEKDGPIIMEYYQDIARLVVYRDIETEEPTESLDLDGALEEKRKQ